MEYELKLANGRSVVWEGNDPLDAARSYVDAHRAETVVAWRHIRHGVHIGLKPIVEP